MHHACHTLAQVREATLASTDLGAQLGGLQADLADLTSLDAEDAADQRTAGAFNELMRLLQQGWLGLNGTAGRIIGVQVRRCAGG